MISDLISISLHFNIFCCQMVMSVRIDIISGILLNFVLILTGSGQSQRQRLAAQERQIFGAESERQRFRSVKTTKYSLLI